MPDKENEEILYKFIDNAYLEIKDVQREFFKTWNNQIKRHLQVKIGRASCRERVLRLV